MPKKEVKTGPHIDDNTHRFYLLRFHFLKRLLVGMFDNRTLRRNRLYLQKLFKKNKSHSKRIGWMTRWHAYREHDAALLAEEQAIKRQREHLNQLMEILSHDYADEVEEIQEAAFADLAAAIERGDIPQALVETMRAAIIDIYHIDTVADILETAFQPQLPEIAQYAGNDTHRMFHAQIKEQHQKACDCHQHHQIEDYLYAIAYLKALHSYAKQCHQDQVSDRHAEQVLRSDYLQHDTHRFAHMVRSVFMAGLDKCQQPQQTRAQQLSELSRATGLFSKSDCDINHDKRSAFSMRRRS